MKTTKYLITVLLAAGLLSCAKESPFDPDFNQNNEIPSSPSGGSAASIGELTSFTIAVDSTALSESETIDPSDEDYIENNTFDNEIKIAFNGTQDATVSGEITGVSVAVSGGHVTVVSTVKGVRYTLTGTTGDGSFKLYGESKYALRLGGVSITNPVGAAINSISNWPTAHGTRYRTAAAMTRQLTRT